MVITGGLWFDEPVDWSRAREVVRTRLVDRFPRFSQRVVEGRAPLSGPHWEGDPNFDLDLHIHQLALPRPGDRAALEGLVADLIATPLDRSKPLWHFHFIDGYERGAAIVVRMHHCIADGIALARVLLSLTDEGRIAVDRPRTASSADQEIAVPWAPCWLRRRPPTRPRGAPVRRSPTRRSRSPATLPSSPTWRPPRETTRGRSPRWCSPGPTSRPR